MRRAVGRGRIVFFCLYLSLACIWFHRKTNSLDGEAGGEEGDGCASLLRPVPLLGELECEGGTGRR